MSTLEKINADLTAAMKEKKEAVLSTLRLLRSALKNKEIELIRELKEEDVLAVIRTQIKQLKDALASFEAAGRNDLVEKNKNELVTLEGYLPAEMPDEDLEKTVRDALLEAGISAKADTGKAMGAVMTAVAGRANAGRVKEVLEKVLV
ncbi:MAG: GatB/YqeY domain-containing protein [Candidatus Uhrbacteria bacterium]